MNLFHTLPLRLLMLAAIFSVVVRAADSGASVPAGSPVMFTTMAWDVLNPNGDLVLSYVRKGQPVSVAIAWRDRSVPLACDGPGALVFSRMVERDGKRQQVPVATAMIPEGMTRALLVFGRNSASGPGEPAIRIMVIDDSYTVFPGQSVRFLNYSKIELGGTLGGQRFSVAPGREQVVPAILPETNRLLSFKLARRDETGGWKKLRSTGLPMTAGLRVLVFLIDDTANPGRPELVVVRDQVEPELPAGTTVAGGRSLRVNPALR